MFMKHHPEVLSITHKLCEPGLLQYKRWTICTVRLKGCVETMRYTVQLDCCKCLRRSKSMTLFQMKHEDFKDYQTIAKQGQYQRIPHTKVTKLLYEQNEPKTVQYKTRFSENWIAQNVVERPATRSTGSTL